MARRLFSKPRSTMRTMHPFSWRPLSPLRPSSILRKGPFLAVPAKRSPSAFLLTHKGPLARYRVVPQRNVRPCLCLCPPESRKMVIRQLQLAADMRTARSLQNYRCLSGYSTQEAQRGEGRKPSSAPPRTVTGRVDGSGVAPRMHVSTLPPFPGTAVYPRYCH